MNEITPLPKEFRVPAEWEPQEAVYLAACRCNEFDPSQFAQGNKSVLDVQLQMIQALVDVVQVRIIASPHQKNRYLTALKEAKIDPSRVEFIKVPHCDIWLRDTGPIWAHSATELTSIWLGFNNWGYYEFIEGQWADCDIPNYLPRNLAEEIDANCFRTPLMGEGGDKSFNGLGSLICCKAVEKNRNPSLSLSELEMLLKASFNVSNIIWVDHGLADDTLTFQTHANFDNANLPGGVYTPLCTGGHVDEFCRFVGSSTVLLADVHSSRLCNMSEIEQITHRNLSEDLFMLQQQTDQYGQPLEIVRMPLPPNMIYSVDQRDPIYSTIRELKGVNVDGPIKVILAASYCNYLISNGVICFPQYYLPGMAPIFKEIDEEAFSIISSLFPKHKIIPINPRPVNAGGGGMHCISNNQPKIGGL